MVAAGLGIIGTALVGTGGLKLTMTEVPRTRVSGVVSNAINIPYTQVVRTGDRSVNTTFYNSSFIVTYQVGETKYSVQMHEPSNSATVENGISISLQYDDSDVTKAYRCCRMSNKQTGAVLIGIGAVCLIAGVSLYALRTNLYVISGQKIQYN